MSLLSLCIPTPHKQKKDKKAHRSRRGPGGGVAPILDQFVSISISQQQLKDSSSVCKHPPLVEEDDSCKKPPVDGERICSSRHHHGIPKSSHHHHENPSSTSFHHHPNYENDSQKSAASSSTSNESQSTHTSGYQTDDGTFEGKILHMATKSKPANIRMTAVKDYNPCCNEELVLRRGQRVMVLYKNNEWVYAMTKTGETGYVPYNYVRPSRKYAGYQSEPEYMADTDMYQSGYDTDMPMTNGSTSYGGARTQIGDMSPSYNIRTGFRGSPENQQYNYQQQSQCSHHGYHQQQQQHHYHRTTRLGSGGSGGYSPPASSSPRNTTTRFASGYTSAVEYPTTSDTRRHPRPAKSLHNILDASGSTVTQNVDRRPTEEKPEVDSFPRDFLEELVVIHDFEAQEEDEAFISKGERVKVLNADDPFWLWVETTPGVQGFVPRSCCSLGNHPCLQSIARQQMANRVPPSSSRNARRHYYQRSRAQMAARQARSQAKQRFHELARQRNNSQNPVLMNKEEIKRVGSKLIVLMDYTATQEDEISIQFAEMVYADVLKQAGAERIWSYCPRTELCGFVPVSLVVPPVV